MILLLLLSTTLLVSGGTVTENCLNSLNGTSQMFEVLPGLGWDNLRNVEEFRVLKTSYKQCRTTADKRFLIPDGIDVEPLKSTFLETFAESFDSYYAFSSTTSASINREFCPNDYGSFGREMVDISGSYAADAQFAMRMQVKTGSCLYRVSARYPRYRATISPETSLHPSFRKRLQKIAALLDGNQTSMAKFETQLLIRDFGTHVVSSVDAGGILQKDDFAMTSSLSAGNKANVSAEFRLQAGMAFNTLFFKTSEGSFGIDRDISGSGKSAVSYSQYLSYSDISVYGGPPFKMGNFNIENWEDGLEENLVAIDRKGTPIFQFINTFLLPEIKSETVYSIENMAKQAFSLYYKHNTIYGCRDTGCENFNTKANVDDGTCGTTPAKTFLFGGTYQECTGNVHVCKKYSHVNLRTNDYSCPKGFVSVMLWTASKSNEAICRTNFFWCDWSDNNGYTDMSYSVYWCAPQPGQQLQSPGLLFGGMWNTAYQVNPVTKGNYCPRGFSSTTLGLDVTMCYADDIENNRNSGASFGGLVSSTAGNPLALKDNSKTYPKKCPSGYTKSLVTIDEDNEVYYCGVIKKSKTYDTNNPVRPPYMRRPSIKQSDLTNALIKMSEMEAVSLKLENTTTGTENTYDLPVKQANDAKPGSNDHSNTATVVMLTVIGGMVLVMLVLVVIAFRRKNRTGENMNLLN